MIFLTTKHNLTAVAAPGSGDDRNAEYTEGSRWIDTLTGTEYICLDATPGSARWQVNPASGIANVAGLDAALGGVVQTRERFVLIERFEQRPLLEAAIDPGTATDPLQAEIDDIFMANRNFAVAGTNMTSALATHNVARGGIRLTTAGAESDQAILQPRSNPAGASRWLAGFSSDLQPVWRTQFRLASIALVSCKAALSLTNAHDLATDADQVGLWLDTTETESVVDNPNFQLITSINGTDVAVDTGIVAAADTEYELEIKLRADRRAEVRLNGVLLGVTGALTTAKTLLPFTSIEALEAEAKAIDIRYEAVSMLNAA